jgi:hypothetical protein
MEAKIEGKLTWHCCICYNSAKGRVDFFPCCFFLVLEYIDGFVAMIVSRLKSFLLSRHINKSNTCGRVNFENNWLLKIQHHKDEN